MTGKVRVRRRQALLACCVIGCMPVALGQQNVSAPEIRMTGNRMPFEIQTTPILLTGNRSPQTINTQSILMTGNRGVEEP